MENNPLYRRTLEFQMAEGADSNFLVTHSGEIMLYREPKIA